VGLKVRDLYEVPAAAIILTAHKELEKLVGTIHQNNFKPHLDDHWAYLGLRGPLVRAAPVGPERADGLGERAGHRRDHDAALQGNARPVARSSPNALYDPRWPGFGESGGLFSQQASPGFIELWSLQSRMAYNVRNRGKDSQ
jgi:argininosuccinate synthase